MLFWIDYKGEIFQLDGRTKWWNRSAQEREKETMKERIKRNFGICFVFVILLYNNR
jgi:hypothetical protein